MWQRKQADPHHDLETVERLGLSSLDLGRESLNKVLVDDTVRLSVESVAARRVKEEHAYSSEEGKDVLNKVSLIVVELILPVVKIRGKVDLLSSPERGLSLLVHLPDLRLMLASIDASTRKRA